MNETNTNGSIGVQKRPKTMFIVHLFVTKRQASGTDDDDDEATGSQKIFYHL